VISTESALAWLVILVVLCGISTYQITHHWRIQTDILELLPHDQQEPAIQTIKRMVAGELGRTALFLIGHTQPEIARDATRQLGRLIDASPVFSGVQWDYSQQPRAFFEFYFPFRYQFISPTIRQYLDKEGRYQDFIEHLKREIYQPMSSFSTRLLAEDPLLFFAELAKNFGTHMTQLNHLGSMNEKISDQKVVLNAQSLAENPERNVTIEDGMIGTTFMGRHYYFVMAQLAANPFEEKTQAQLEKNWQAWSNRLRQTAPELELTYTAVARFASSMRHHMQRDMLFISVGSTVGVVFLMIVVFRSVKQLLIAFIPLVLGLWSALGVSLFIFEGLHAFTLVFGTSLIGVCIDYSMHYFVYHRLTPNWESIVTMRRIFPALSLGALTTILSYTVLGLTPLVGLQQIAIFASCGIFVSLLTVILWFPFLLRGPHPLASHIPRFYYGLTGLLSLSCRYKVYLCFLLIFVIAFSIGGIFVLRVNDSPLAFKTFPADLTTQDRFVRDMMGMSEAQQYLVVEGKNAEEALQRLETFQDYIQLNTIRFGAELGPMITSFLPSKKRQEENARSVRKLLVHEQSISSELMSIGLRERIIAKLFSDLEREPETFLTPDAWLNHSVSIGLRNLWLEDVAGEISIVVRLQNITDVQRIQDLISSFEGIRYVDYIADLSRILGSYRRNILVFVIGAHVLIFALLFWRYHLKGFFVILPPLLGACITVGLLGLLGQTFHLLHCLALLLVLGMGVDYAIFLAESDPASQPKTFLAATLATVTTVLSFGLLSFSSQEALKAIGLTTFVGISCVWLLSPIAIYGQWKS
jgi:predicted exporter